jgi:ribosome-binding ATPase YchF (GTP1/OBG family)
MLEIWRHKYYCRFDFVTFIDIFPFCVILTNIGVVTTISLRFSNIQKILLNQEKCYYFNLATFE